MKRFAAVVREEAQGEGADNAGWPERGDEEEDDEEQDSENDAKSY